MNWLQGEAIAPTPTASDCGFPTQSPGSGRRIRSMALVLLMLGGLVGVGGCSLLQSCPQGLHSYKDKCLTTMAIQYVGCTEGKGINTTTEIGAGVSGTFEVVADASLELAYKKVQEENTPVALQIVTDCLEIAKTTSPPDDPEQAVAAEFQRRVIDQTPRVTVSPSSAREGQDVTVSGSRFWPAEIVDIRVHVALVAQVQADAEGRFTTVITIPSNAPPPSFPTTIVATGQSSAKSAEVPFQTEG